MNGRYANLILALDEIAKTREHLNMVEVGTYDGNRAVGLANHWLGKGKEHSMTYVGFDLFEGMTPSLNKKELSKSKLPPAMKEVQRKFRLLGDHFQHKLFPGNTQTTLAEFVKSEPFGVERRWDLIFMDGGHSLGTVASDWSHCLRLMGSTTLCLLDDYYDNNVEYGCKPLVDKLIFACTQPLSPRTPKLAIKLLDPVDIGAQDLEIRMVRIMRG